MPERVPAQDVTTSSKGRSASDMPRIEEASTCLRRHRWCKLKGFPCRGSDQLIDLLTWSPPHARVMAANSWDHHKTSRPMTSNALNAAWVDRLHLLRWEPCCQVSQHRKICPTMTSRGKQTRRKLWAANYKDWSPWKGAISWICIGRWKQPLARVAIKEATAM